MPRVKLPHFALCSAAISGAAQAQCTPAWIPMPTASFLADEVKALTTWTEGNQTRLIAGGNFQSTGGQAIRFVAAWDAGAWQPVGAPLGTDGSVFCLGRYDPDDTGPQPVELIAGGVFLHAGGVPANRIASWRYPQWSALGSGLLLQPISPIARALCQFGPELVVAGDFSSAGGVPAPGLARWNGSAWSAFPDQTAASPWTLHVHQGDLYAGGYWQVPGGVTSVLRWNGSNWVTVGPNFPHDPVFALTTYQGKLIAGGWFANCCSSNGPEPGEFIAAFDGASWQPLGLGLGSRVTVLFPFDPDGPGPLPELLIAGGLFITTGSGLVVNHIAAWDGAQWSALGSGVNGEVKALAVYNNQLAIGGDFTEAGGMSALYFALYGCPQPPPCYPNCDASTAQPILNIADFVCFLNRFAAADPYANCDNSTAPPTLNVNDFICFLNRFARGCN